MISFGWLRRARTSGPQVGVTPQLALPTGPLPEECTNWRQGDIFGIDHVLVTGPENAPAVLTCPQGVVVVSQSCDASQPKNLMIHVSPIVILEGTFAAEARKGKRPQYALLPELGDHAFADLSVVTTTAKVALVGSSRVPGVCHDEDVRRLAGTVSRKYGRFAFPDDVVHALEPMRKALASKASSEESALGRILKQVYAVRVESTSGWADAPYVIQLIVILEPGALNETGLTAEEKENALPEPPSDWRAGAAISVNQAAVRLASESSPAVRAWLWAAIAQAWADQCEASADKAGVRAQVPTVTFELATADEFPLSRVNVTEALDLDYLSEPFPRSAGRQG